MGYRLERDEPASEGLKRIVREELESACNRLSHVAPDRRDEAVHEARKSGKKIRAIIRLIRSDLARGGECENAAIRDAGRSLSEFRDAVAMVETFDELRTRYRDKARPEAFARVRAALERRREDARHRLAASPVLKDAASAFDKTREEVRRWPAGAAGFSAIESGVAEIYSRSRKAFADARKHSSAGVWHEFRKRTKDHWYLIRLLEGLWTDVMDAYEKSVKQLETWLGDVHNLVVLSELIEAEPDFYGGRKLSDEVLDAVRKYRRELRRDALSLAERIYEEKPRDFVHRMRDFWAAWKKEPKSFENMEKEKRQRNKKEAKSTAKAARPAA